jgi:hypothetical protein
VRSTATVTTSSSGQIDRSTSLAISGIRLPALKFTVPATSPGPAPIPNMPFPSVPLPFAGTTVVDPVLGFYDGQFTIQFPALGKQQFAVPYDSVVQSFKAAGYDLDYAAPRKTPDGIIGSTLRLHFQLPAPPDNPLYAGVSDFTIVLGRANASITTESGTSTASAPGGAPAAGPAGYGGTAAPAPALAAPSAGNPYQVSDSAARPAEAAEPVGDDAAAPTRELSGTTAGFEATKAFGDTGPLRNLFLVLAAAGLLAVFSIPTLRLRGARNR